MKHCIERFDVWVDQVEPEAIERVSRPLRFLLLIPFQSIIWPLRKVWNWAESSSAPKIWTPAEFKQVIPGVLIDRLAPGEKMSSYVNNRIIETMAKSGVSASDVAAVFGRKSVVNSMFAAAAARDTPPPIAWVCQDSSCVGVRHPDGGITMITIQRLIGYDCEPKEFIRKVNARQSIERSELASILGAPFP